MSRRLRRGRPSYAACGHGLRNRPSRFPQERRMGAFGLPGKGDRAHRTPLRGWTCFWTPTRSRVPRQAATGRGAPRIPRGRRPAPRPARAIIHRQHAAGEATGPGRHGRCRRRNARNRSGPRPPRAKSVDTCGVLRMRRQTQSLWRDRLRTRRTGAEGARSARSSPARFQTLRQKDRGAPIVRVRTHAIAGPACRPPMDAPPSPRRPPCATSNTTRPSSNATSAPTTPRSRGCSPRSATTRWTR